MWKKHNNPNQNLKHSSADNAKVTTSGRIAPLSLVKVGPNILGYKKIKGSNINCLSYFKKKIPEQKRMHQDSWSIWWWQFRRELESNLFWVQKRMCEEEGEASDWLHDPHTDAATISELFIEGFHALYHVQIGELKVAALFDTGASINAISSKVLGLSTVSWRWYLCIEKLYQQMAIV